MATSGEVDEVNKVLAHYFDTQLELLKNTRIGMSLNTEQYQLDDHKRISSKSANVEMIKSMVAEEDARKKLKLYVAVLLHLSIVHYLPGEVHWTQDPYYKHRQALEESHHVPILKKMGFALKEIDETKEYMRGFLTAHEAKEHYLHSAWDMEMYKLQNAYVNLKKKVF
jgi:hypothetical protein